MEYSVRYRTNISHISIIVNKQLSRFLRLKTGDSEVSVNKLTSSLIRPLNKFFHLLFIKSSGHPVVTVLSKIEIIMKIDQLLIEA